MAVCLLYLRQVPRLPITLPQLLTGRLVEREETDCLFTCHPAHEDTSGRHGRATNTVPDICRPADIFGSGKLHRQRLGRC